MNELSLNKSLVRYLVAMFITVLTSQATMVVDAAVGGNLLGADAVAAVDLVMPVYELFYALVMMLGMGGCTVASMCLGRGDVMAVRRHFTAAVGSSLVVMGLLGVGIVVLRDRVVGLLCGESYLRGFTQDYLVAMVPYFVLAGLTVIFMIFTSMAGRPVLMMCCAIVQFCVNVLCNFLLIKVAGLGIEALAYSSALSCVVTLLLLMPYYLSAACPFRMIFSGLRVVRGSRLATPASDGSQWSAPAFSESQDVTPASGESQGSAPALSGSQDDARASGGFRGIMSALGGNIRYGVGFFVVDMAYAVTAYSMNSLVLEHSGEQGLFFWSVVLMIYLTGDYASSAAQETSLMLGGRLFGAGRRVESRKVYNRSMLFALGWIALILLAVFVCPRLALPLFGAADAEVYPLLQRAIACAAPFVVCVILGNLLFVRLVQRGKIVWYTVLSCLLYLAVPLGYYLFR